jgi:hypothetical protein
VAHHAAGANGVQLLQENVPRRRELVENHPMSEEHAASAGAVAVTCMLVEFSSCKQIASGPGAGFMCDGAFGLKLELRAAAACRGLGRCGRLSHDARQRPWPAQSEWPGPGPAAA